MASWGIELELPGILLELHIHSVEVELRLPGEADARHYKLNIAPMRMGPTRTEEFENLKSLSRKIARFLNEQDIPKNISVQNVDFTQAVWNFINTQKREFFNLYKCETELKMPSFLPAVHIYESRIRQHFIFSADHYDEFVIPELITEPFGLGRMGFNENQLKDEDAFAFLQSTYRYATALCQNLPLRRNVEVYLPILRIIGELFDIIPNSLQVTAIGIMHLTPNPNTPLYITPQLNTIVDLTHFSSGLRAGLPDPLQDLLRLSNIHTFNWLPTALGQNRLIDYEVAILNFTRKVVNNMDVRLDRVLKWIGEQDAIQAKEYSNTSFVMLANIQIELEQTRTLRAQQNLLINELKAINAKVVERHWFDKKSVLVTMPTELKISTAQISRQIENFNERIQRLLSDGREALHKAHAAAVASRTFARTPAGQFAVPEQPDRNAAIIAAAAAAAETAEENSKRIYDQMLRLSTESWEMEKKSKEITTRIKRVIG